LPADEGRGREEEENGRRTELLNACLVLDHGVALGEPLTAVLEVVKERLAHLGLGAGCGVGRSAISQGSIGAKGGEGVEKECGRWRVGGRRRGEGKGKTNPRGWRLLAMYIE
jgi:hypothetical protein